MMDDEILREAREIKEALAARHGYNVRKIAAAAHRFATDHPLPGKRAVEAGLPSEKRPRSRKSRGHKPAA